MRRLALIALILVASAATAQPVFNQFDLDGQQQQRFAIADCDGPDMTLLFDVAVDGPQYQLRFVEYPVNGILGACPTRRDDPDAIELFDEETQISSNGQIFFQRTLKRSDLMGASCNEVGRRTSVYFCAQLYLLPNDLDTVGGASFLFDIDTTTPPDATVTRVQGGDGEVIVSVNDISSDGGDSYTFLVEHRLCPLADDVVDEVDPESTCGAGLAIETTEGSAPSISVTVPNDRTVEFRVSAVDDFDNIGEPTEWQQGTPVADVSPLALYDGGANALSCAPSGCSGTSSAALFGALLLLRRRRKRWLGGLMGLVVVCGATSASAQSNPVDAEASRPWPGLGRSTVYLSVGSYKPNIDADSSFPVYDCFFEGATLPHLSGGGDLHLWDGFGSIQVSLGMDVTQANGFAQPLDAGALGSCQTPTKTAVQVTFVSLRPGLTYRFDPLLDWIGFPLVPYGRVGLVGTGYLFSKGGEVSSDDPNNPIGMRLGTEVALGLMLALDFLDGIDPFTPDATQRARASGVFDHTFVFVEGAAQDVTTFGAPGFDLSPRDDFLNSGLPATFKIGIAVELL